MSEGLILFKITNTEYKAKDIQCYANNKCFQIYNTLQLDSAC